MHVTRVLTVRICSVISAPRGFIEARGPEQRADRIGIPIAFTVAAGLLAPKRIAVIPRAVFVLNFYTFERSTSILGILSLPINRAAFD